MAGGRAGVSGGKRRSSRPSSAAAHGAENKAGSSRGTPAGSRSSTKQNIKKKKKKPKSKTNSETPSKQKIAGDKDEGVFEVESLLNHLYDDDGNLYYLVKWKGYPLDQATYQRSSDLLSCGQLIRAYEARVQGSKRRAAKKSQPGVQQDKPLTEKASPSAKTPKRKEEARGETKSTPKAGTSPGKAEKQRRERAALEKQKKERERRKRAREKLQKKKAVRDKAVQQPRQQQQREKPQPHKNKTSESRHLKSRQEPRKRAVQSAKKSSLVSARRAPRHPTTKPPSERRGSATSTTTPPPSSSSSAATTTAPPSRPVSSSSPPPEHRSKTAAIARVQGTEKEAAAQATTAPGTSTAESAGQPAKRAKLGTQTTRTSATATATATGDEQAGLQERLLDHSQEAGGVSVERLMDQLSTVIQHMREATAQQTGVELLTSTRRMVKSMASRHVSKDLGQRLMRVIREVSLLIDTSHEKDKQLRQLRERVQVQQQQLEQLTPAQEERPLDSWNDTCFVCDQPGALLCCQYCPNVVHPFCVQGRPLFVSQFACVKCAHRLPPPRMKTTFPAAILKGNTRMSHTCRAVEQAQQSKGPLSPQAALIASGDRDALLMRQRMLSRMVTVLSQLMRNVRADAEKEMGQQQQSAAKTIESNATVTSAPAQAPTPASTQVPAQAPPPPPPAPSHPPPALLPQSVAPFQQAAAFVPAAAAASTGWPSGVGAPAGGTAAWWTRLGWDAFGEGAR